MSFWSTTEGEEITKTEDGSFDMGGGSMLPLPEGTQVLAAIDEAKWDKKDEAEFISLRWTVLAPEEFFNRKIFQKLFVSDLDPSQKDISKAEKKRDKAKRMLAAIDTNAGGKLLAKPVKPSDEAMTLNLTNKPMVIKAMVWSIKDAVTGETAMGNWVGAVAPKTAPTTSAEDIVKGQAKMPQPGASSGGGSGGGSRSGGGRADMDDELPF